MATEKRELKAGYLAQAADLQALWAWPWPLTDFSPLLEARAKFQTDRETLVEELLRQNRPLPQSKLMLDNIALLSDPKTFTITTGHQVCLMGGPMFTLYKIATTIALAGELADKYPSYHFVPVLWMATEDHDWEEVNHFFKAFDEKLIYPATFKGPVGRHVLEPSIVDALPDDLPAPLRAFYQPGTTMAEAFRQLMHHLFGKYGLVILDADRPNLKRILKATMAQELEGEGMAKPVRATSAYLEELGIKPQINARAINLFYIGDGGRSVIEWNDEGYRLKDNPKTWTKAEIFAELEAAPENFSPNVALRPVYQEILLPSLAYIGGWAEMGYWLQLKAGFDKLGVPFPLLVPRIHATIFNRVQAESLEALGIPLDKITEPLHLLNDFYLSLHWDETPLETQFLKVDQSFGELAVLLETIDPTLASAIRAEQARTINTIDGLRKKVKKSIRNRNPQPYQTLAVLKNAIEPENNPQQRTLNFTALDQGESLHLIDQIVQLARDAKAEHQWIRLY